MTQSAQVDQMGATLIITRKKVLHHIQLITLFQTLERIQKWLTPPKTSTKLSMNLARPIALRVLMSQKDHQQTMLFQTSEETRILSAPLWALVQLKNKRITSGIGFWSQQANSFLIKVSHQLWLHLPPIQNWTLMLSQPLIMLKQLQSPPATKDGIHLKSSHSTLNGHPPCELGNES